MIRFEPVSAEVVLDCDQDPKTRFRLKSLTFADEQAVVRQLEEIGVFPAAELRAISKRLTPDGKLNGLTDDESANLDRILLMVEAKNRLICSRGVVEIDCKPVTPEQVLDMLGAIPEPMRGQVVGELVGRIQSIGKPDPKSERPSGLPLGSGRTAITTDGAASSAT